MKPAKKMKWLKQAHTPNSKIGTGDYYGTAIKQKVGKPIESSMMMHSIKPKALKKPPKSLA